MNRLIKSILEGRKFVITDLGKYANHRYLVFLVKDEKDAAVPGYPTMSQSP